MSQILKLPLRHELLLATFTFAPLSDNSALDGLFTVADSLDLDCIGTYASRRKRHGFIRRQQDASGRQGRTLSGVRCAYLLTAASQTVLITGGSEGMGLAAATQLSAKGASLILVSRSAAKLEEAIKAVKVRLPTIAGPMPYRV